MKTKIIFAIAFATTSMAFAQKKEVKAIEKAIKSGSYGEAKSLLAPAEALSASMDEKTKEKFMLLKAQAFLGVDNQNQEDLDKAAMAYTDLKDTKYSNEAETGLANVTSAYINAAVADQNKEEYSNAAQKLEKAYNLSKKDTVYLYFAASNAINAKDYDKALGYYEELKSLGFKGRDLSYVATSVATGEVETFSSKQERDIQVLSKEYVKPDTQLGDSKSAEIAKNIALIYISKNENEKALAAMADARRENPDDILLLRSEADIYLKMKQMDKYEEVITKVLEKDPNNAELLYNLGVGSDQQGNKKKAKEYYLKAVEIDPSYASAYNNIAVLILSGERAIVDEMNSLGTSRADNDKYEALKSKRKDVYKEAVPYLEKALVAKPDYLDVAKSLYGIYEQLGETSKADAMKATIEKLEGSK